MAKNFCKEVGKLVAAVYLSGIAIHLLQILSPDFTLDQTPFWFDAWIVVAAGIGGLGMFCLFHRAIFPSRLAIVIYGGVTLHLIGSSGLHAYVLLARRHELFSLFSTSYSYAFILIAGGLIWYAWSLEFKAAAFPKKDRPPLRCFALTSY